MAVDKSIIIDMDNLPSPGTLAPSNGPSKSGISCCASLVEDDGGDNGEGDGEREMRGEHLVIGRTVEQSYSIAINQCQQ